MPNDDDLKEILTNAFCPQEFCNDNFDKFVDERAELLATFAKQLMQDV
jgi:hypothetical protein